QKDIRDIANVLGQFPPMYERAKGVSQDLTAAINRHATIWRFQVRILRKLEGHCARMVKVTQDYFDRALLTAVEELLASPVDVIKHIGGEEGMKLFHRLLQEEGLKLPKR